MRSAIGFYILPKLMKSTYKTVETKKEDGWIHCKPVPIKLNPLYWVVRIIAPVLNCTVPNWYK